MKARCFKCGEVYGISVFHRMPCMREKEKSRGEGKWKEAKY